MLPMCRSTFARPIGRPWHFIERLWGLGFRKLKGLIVSRLLPANAGTSYCARRRWRRRFRHENGSLKPAASPAPPAAPSLTCIHRILIVWHAGTRWAYSLSIRMQGSPVLWFAGHHDLEANCKYWPQEDVCRTCATLSRLFQARPIQSIHWMSFKLSHSSQRHSRWHSPLVGPI